LGYVAGGIFAVASGILFIPAFILMLPFASSDHQPFQQGSGFTTNAYATIAGVVSLPSMLAGSLSYFLTSTGAWAMRDHPTILYKGILHKLIRVMGGNPMQIVDELEPLEDQVVQRFSRLFPGCNLYDCLPDDILPKLTPVESQTNQSQGDDHTREEILHRLWRLIRDVPVVATKLCVVGRIYKMRKILQNQYVIGFIGVHNAGKSTTISKLLHIDTGADMLVRTEEPKLYPVGGWLDAVSRRSCREFEDWRSNADRDDLKVQCSSSLLLLIFHCRSMQLTSLEQMTREW
jgi:hypothetical protein